MIKPLKSLHLASRHLLYCGVLQLAFFVMEINNKCTYVHALLIHIFQIKQHQTVINSINIQTIM